MLQISLQKSIKILTFVVITLLLCIKIHAAVPDKFLHFTEIDGLPRNITTCLEQDRYGYLWIGTGNGIARYDGKSFYSYNELSGLGTIALLNDSKNRLWAATDKGLFIYNRLTNSFELKVGGFTTKVQEDNGKIYFLQVGRIGCLDGNEITYICQEVNPSDFCFAKEGIWISSNNQGVKLLSRESGFKKVVTSCFEDQFVLIIQKTDNKLFVGCRNGKLFAIGKSRQTSEIKLDNHYAYKRIVKIGNETWLATDGAGIIILDQNLHYSRSLNRNQNTGESINSNSIYDIFPGRNHEIWLATYGAGLTCMLPDNLLFKNILPEKGNENSLIANEGISIYINSPYFYLGTNYGLSAWNEPANLFKNLTVAQLKKDLKGIKVSAINVDQNNDIWVATYDGLLGKYTSGFRLLKTYHPVSKDMDEMQQIVFLHSVNQTNLLIVTHFQNRNLLNFDPEKETANAFELYSKGSNQTYCLLNSLRENRDGELLALISDKGLFHVNWKDNVLVNKLEVLNKQIGCYVSDFYQDPKGFYWFASSSNGLLRISPDGTNYKKWTVKEGLPSNTLLRIESVDGRYLWISSIAGLSRFDTETETVQNFNHRDGLPANEFLERVSAKTPNGRIIFGSIAGFTIVNPTKVAPDTSKTEIIISDITFQNQSIHDQEGKQYLKQPLEETKEITLPYNKNSFSIHFFAKDNSFLKYHNYAYRLIGLEKEWISLGETNQTTYTNLSPGTYTFEIKSTGKSSEIAHPTQLAIHIQSPWYFSWIAYIVYFGLFSTILYLSVYAYLKRVELKKEKEISEFKIQKEHELTEKKLAFFTNISHDLKTPLTLIDAPVNDLLHSKNLGQEQINQLMVVRRNSKRLYKLITDLLDFRKITQKQYVLEVQPTNISRLIDEVYQAFNEECKNKSVGFECLVTDNLTCFVDSKKIEKILWNLLSNALKFTSKGGSIRLVAEEQPLDEKKVLNLTVSDSGIGIAESDKARIFDRFFQVRGTQSTITEGSGIGLSIVKELVEMHHGNISVESAPGKGTKFTITIPSDPESYSGDELALFKDPFPEESEEPEEQTVEQIAEALPKSKHYNLPTLLVVEDNQELREYLAAHFAKDYKIHQAENGLEGLAQAQEVNPDLILTDVQMPKMNGYEFCKEIRKNFETSHIPVVMLTANSTIEQQIEGLSTGADAYISKPFDIKLLDTTLISVLENRRALRAKFLGVAPIEDAEKSLPHRDIDFIEELSRFIDENIDNVQLNVDLIATHFSVSPTKLNRKIKSLLGATPNNLIKSIRLKKAYKLLQKEGARVSEVAFLTGFTDPNYFTTCFKKEFGENPSQIGTK